MALRGSAGGHRESSRLTGDSTGGTARARARRLAPRSHPRGSDEASGTHGRAHGDPWSPTQRGQGAGRLGHRSQQHTSTSVLSTSSGACQRHWLCSCCCRRGARAHRSCRTGWRRRRRRRSPPASACRPGRCRCPGTRPGCPPAPTRSPCRPASVETGGARHWRRLDARHAGMLSVTLGTGKYRRLQAAARLLHRQRSHSTLLVPDAQAVLQNASSCRISWPCASTQRHAAVLLSAARAC